MTTLVRKLLRDIRLPLVVVMLFLLGFQVLWVKITQRVVGQLVPFFTGLAAVQKLSPIDIEEQLFRGPGKIMQTLMGGEGIQFARAMDTLSIGYVHPLMLTLFCIWAIGRSSGAIAGELDRGTLELLLAQPQPRSRVVLAHLVVDLITIPLLCLALWAGTGLGVWLVGPITINPADVKLFPFIGKAPIQPEQLALYPASIGPALLNVAVLIFAVSGFTMWLSAAGRFRYRVLGAAVLIILFQFLVNVVGQMWDAIGFLRPLTIFYYYQPQPIILQHDHRWSVELGALWNGGQPLLAVPVLLVPLVVGTLGYLLALWTFCRRDLPAPL